MALSPDLLEILVCPENRTRLVLADEALVAKLNSAIKATSLKNKGGEAVSDAVQACLIREDEAVLYPVRDDIPVLLIQEGIATDQLSKED